MLLDTTFAFSKLHYLPEDLVSAGKLIGTIGQNLVECEVSFHTNKANDKRLDTFGNIFIEIFDTDNDKTRILTLIFDSKEIKFHKIKSRDEFKNITEQNYSIDQILEFCQAYRKSTSKDTCIPSTIFQTPKSPGNFYVYRHLFPNGKMYIGKGKNNRVNDLNSRSAIYKRTLLVDGTPKMEKLCEGISEESAYQIECKLIKELREHYGFNFLLNTSSGMEQAKDIGEMPIGTVQMLLRLNKLSLDDPKFMQPINIFKRMSPDPGSSKWYYKDISIYDAALFLKCTMNEAISAKNTNGVVINGFSILSDSEFEKEVKRP